MAGVTKDFSLRQKLKSAEHRVAALETDLEALRAEFREWKGKIFEVFREQTRGDIGRHDRALADAERRDEKNAEAAAALDVALKRLRDYLGETNCRLFETSERVRHLERVRHHRVLGCLKL